MRSLKQCERKGCGTVEIPGMLWWGVMLASGSAQVRPYEPGMVRRTGEIFVCGEACVTRAFCLWMAEESRRRQLERQERNEVLVLERMMR